MKASIEQETETLKVITGYELSTAALSLKLLTYSRI